LAIALLSSLLAATGCTCDLHGDSASGGAEADAAVALAPLQADSWHLALPVAGHLPAAVAVPLGATRPRPIVVALHGDFDRPEWHCGAWRGITGGHPFVLCPRGVPRLDSPPQSERFTYDDVKNSEHELRGALRALKARFGRYVSPGPVVLAGLTRGASHAVLLSKQEPSFFSRLVLVDGGHDRWTSGNAAAFSQRGGQRVLFLCTNDRCSERAQRSSLFAQGGGAEARAVRAGAGARGLDAHAAATLKQHWMWLVAGDQRY
jgi:hypothetical protein